MWLLGCLWKTLRLTLTTETDDDGNACVCIEVSHVAHVDGEGCSRLHATRGKGAMIDASRKLGLVMSSSTEIEMLSCGETFPKCAWFRHFRMTQGDADKEDMRMHDNKSCVLSHKNYPFSIGKGTNHVHVRYFFVVDKIDKKEVKVECCPIEKMIADCNSKPTQSSLFIYQRNVVKRIDEKDTPSHKRWF